MPTRYARLQPSIEAKGGRAASEGRPFASGDADVLASHSPRRLGPGQTASHSKMSLSHNHILSHTGGTDETPIRTTSSRAPRPNPVAPKSGSTCC